MYIWWFDTKLQSLGELPAKTACPGKIWLMFENFFRATRRLFWMIPAVIGRFLEFGPSDQLDIAYWDTAKQSPWYGNSIGDVGHD